MQGYPTYASKAKNLLSGALWPGNRYVARDT